MPSSPSEWAHRWERDGVATALFAHLGNGSRLVEFPGLARFAITGGGRGVRGEPIGGTPLETLAHLFLNQAFPLALSLRPKALVLHAAAAVPLGMKGAIAFAGDTGAGKSTLAAAFGLLGSPVLSDDGLFLENREGGFLARPSHPLVRLRPDMARALLPEGESSLAAPAPSGGPAPLKAVFLLDSSDGPQAPGSGLPAFERAKPAEVLIELRDRVFRLDFSPAKRREEFELLGLAAEAVPCFRCRFRRGALAPGQVAETVAEFARRLP